MSIAPTRLACAWLFCLAAAACTPDVPTAGTVVNPGVGAPDAVGADQASGDASDSDADAEADAAVADTPDILTDADSADADAAETYMFDATKPELPGAPDIPVVDSVPDFDLWPPSDLGQRYDPDIWQELPMLPDIDPPIDAVVDVDAAPEVDAGAEVDAAPEVETVADVAEVDTAPDVAAEIDSSAETIAEVDTVAETVAEVDIAADTPAELDTSTDTAFDADADAGADQASDAVSDSADTLASDDGPGPDSADSAEITDALAPDAPDVQQDASEPDVIADVPPGCTAKTCDDGEPCTVDACLPSGKCTHSTLPTGAACLEGVCHQGLCSRNSPDAAGTSCKELKLNTSTAQSGVWWLDPDGPFGVWLPYPVWCDMVAEGGGWTLLLKVGETGALGYDSPLWTSITTLNPGSPRMDEQDAKFDSYWSVPHTELRVGMHVGNQVAWLVLPLEGTSLFHLMKDDKPVLTSLPTAQWLGLLPGTKIQSGCHAQGLNVDPGLGATAKYNFARVRIGLVGNTESDCQTADSRIGLGGAGGTCGQNPAMTCGNAAGCYDGALIANQPAFGYVFAR